MKDEFKRATELGFTVWDLNSKWVINRNRSKDAKRVKRAARRKMKENLKKELDNMAEE